MWVDFLHVHGKTRPSHPALILCSADDPAERQVITYRQLDLEASRWALWFKRYGVKPGERIALLARNRLEHLTMFFGCTKIGAVLAPLNFRLGDEELVSQLEVLEPTLFFGVGESSVDHSSVYMDIESIELPDTEPFEGMALEFDSLLLMLFTSGSTGRAKGVMLHAEMLLWNAINTQTGWGLRVDDVTVVHTPFFHSGGYNVTCLPLLRLGGMVVLIDRFEPLSMLSLIAREKVSVFFAVPTMFAMMAARSEFSTSDFSTLRFCVSGGAPCPVALIRTWREAGVPLKQGFGLTEVGPNCFAMSDEEATVRPGSVGRPMLHSHVKLIDADGHVVQPGEIGELCIAGPHVCAGYWRQSETFNSVFRDGFFHTGDLMRFDQDGFYEVVGRAKDMYISGGENVYPGEVVRCLLQHPSIRDAMVLPVPDATWGEVGFAFLITSESLDLEAICAFLQSRLARYKHPRHVHLLEAFPLLPNNKPDVRFLKSIALQAVNDG